MKRLLVLFSRKDDAVGVDRSVVDIHQRENPDVTNEAIAGMSEG
ncbi:hypothetical protein [Undibacterium fentianense]|nr:hypothetical protein [Undibacterium fentianense]